ncbi:MAG: hypothetical protein ACR2MM_09025 [Flavobacteriaceae bacterium]
MKINRITKTGIALVAGITGGLVFLLFFFFGIGIKPGNFYVLVGLFATIIFTTIVFLLMNSDWK